MMPVNSEKKVIDSSILPAWWADYAFESGMVRCWKIASLQLWLQRLDHEWRVAFREETEAAHLDVIVNGEEVPGVPESDVIHERYLFRGTEKALRIIPALAPRSVVVRFVTPLHVPANESVTLYVVTPLWMQFLSSDRDNMPFRELAVILPSDTWFGANTREGELGYAARTPGQLELAQVHPKQYQAVTCVKIHNQSSEMLEFERINVPVTYLSLYNDEHNHLWTQNVSLVWTEDTLMAQLDIEDSPPAHLGKAQRISGPREEIDRRLLVRAFNALFS
jgi:hypothetical protein